MKTSCHPLHERRQIEEEYRAMNSNKCQSGRIETSKLSRTFFLELLIHSLNPLLSTRQPELTLVQGFLAGCESCAEGGEVVFCRV